jgi:vancomycin resistance protein VanW
MTLHTPLTVAERWRHSYDVFPDADRRLPFGSGATCSWPTLDFQVENHTPFPYRLAVRVTETHLEGRWDTVEPFPDRFEVYETGHRFTHEGVGIYLRHNQLWRRRLDEAGATVAEELAAENHALVLYQPFLPPGAAETEPGAV